jgi:tight adherence protein C
MALGVTLASVFLVVFSATSAALILFGRKRHPAARRIMELQGEASTGGKPRKAGALKVQKEKLAETAAGVLRGLGRFTRQSEKKKSRLRASLVQAGFNAEDSVKMFVGIKLLSAVVFLVLFFVIGLHGNRNPSTLFLLPLAGFGFGTLLPNLVLNHAVQKRQEQIAGSLADAIDLLVISVEAGLGLNAALLRVGQDMAVRCKPISEEFGRVNQELRTGVSREKALRNLSGRNRVEDLKIFVGALVLTDRLGTSIADTLRVQADSLRTRLRQKAEEQAAKAGIKMLFPLVFFILPALIIILMGPAVISVLRTFNK